MIKSMLRNLKLTGVQSQLGGARQSFSGRAAIVMFGSIAGQGIAFLLLPVITRIYEPAVIGQAASVISIVSILAIIISLQYEQAIVVAGDYELPFLVILASAIAGLFTLTIFGLISFASTISISNDNYLLQQWGIDWMLPVLSLTYAHFLILVNLRLRDNKLRLVALARVIYYGIGATLQVVGGLLLGSTVRTFLTAQIITTLICLVILFPYRRFVGWLAKCPKPRQVALEMYSVARTYINFPKYQVAGNLLNSASIYAPVIIVRFVFSDEWAGWYYIAWRMLAVPATLLSQAIGQVFYRDSADRERKGEKQSRILERVVIGLISVSLIPSITLWILAPSVTILLLGEAWINVATIMRILLFSAIVTFFTSPISTLLLVKGKQAGDLRFKGALFVVRGIAIAFGCILNSVMLLIAFYSAVSVGVMLLYFRYIVLSVHGSMNLIWAEIRPLIRDGIVLILFAGSLWFVNVLDHPLGIALVSIVAITLYLRTIMSIIRNRSDQVQTID